jgi:uncharacterized protein YkwD
LRNSLFLASLCSLASFFSSSDETLTSALLEDHNTGNRYGSSEEDEHMLQFRNIGLLVVLCSVLVTTATAFDPTTQTSALLYDEALTVYYGNLARRAERKPPLRWNRQLTYASRWFAWDSVENRPTSYCGHQDTNGQWPSDRAPRFGYLGNSGTENAYCGYMLPQDAINGWLNSPGHRANLLSDAHREIGLGYYRRASDGRGYIAQLFGNDAAYAPVIIENEAINTLNPEVALYIHQTANQNSFTGARPATEMMIASEPCFVDTTWQPFTPEPRFRLPNGEGWRTVYVKTRDTFGATRVVSDTIYVGANPPIAELAATLSDRQPTVTLSGLGHPSLPQVQFSPGWLVDDTFSTFSLLWGAGERVTDPDAWGGSAFRLGLADLESSAWVWEYQPTVLNNLALVAYVRLKVANNTSSNQVARISIKSGDTEYGPLVLRGIDFAVANQYQEFALPFVYRAGDPFLTIQFWRSGSTEVFVDAVTLFSTPQPIMNPFTLDMFGGNYRGQGIWVRYTNGVTFSDFSEIPVIPSQPIETPVRSILVSRQSQPFSLTITTLCAQAGMQVTANEPWLTGVTESGILRLSIDPGGMNTGLYEGRVTLTMPGSTFRLTVPVRLRVVEQLFTTFTPLVVR